MRGRTDSAMGRGLPGNLGGPKNTTIPRSAVQAMAGSRTVVHIVEAKRTRNRQRTTMTMSAAEVNTLHSPRHRRGVHIMWANANRRASSKAVLTRTEVWKCHARAAVLPLGIEGGATSWNPAVMPEAATQCAEWLNVLAAYGHQSCGPAHRDKHCGEPADLRQRSLVQQ